MKTSYLLILLLGMACSACSQNKRSNNKSAQNRASETDIKVGGSCEGCEAIYESPIAFDQLKNTDTLSDFKENGPKMEISGTIYQSDGRTPAVGVIMYLYHTDQRGIYPKKGDETGWAKRHGYLRGWIKTDESGKYSFYTLRPASYPEGRNPAHIHATIKEPGKSEYYIDEFLFHDDPFLKDSPPGREPRAGDGVLTLISRDGLLRGARNIILGKNIPGYPH